MNGSSLERVAGVSWRRDLLRELGVDPRDACAGFLLTGDNAIRGAGLGDFWSRRVSDATLEWVNEER